MTLTAIGRPMKNARRFAILSTVALLLGTVGAIAAPSADPSAPPETGEGRHHGPGMGKWLFERWDKDNDGRITIADLPARMKAHMTAIDQNKDGYLTLDEFKQGREQLHAQRQKEMDTNGDGKVSDEERKAAMRAHLVEGFIAQDTNHDGSLTEDEAKMPRWEHLKAADANSDNKVSLDELKVAFDSGKFQPMHRGHGPDGKPPSMADLKARALERFNADDKNHDGALVQAEIPTRWEHLKVADANNDNRITFDELTAAFKTGKIVRHGGHHPPPSENGQGRTK